MCKALRAPGRSFAVGIPRRHSDDLTGAPSRPGSQCRALDRSGRVQRSTRMAEIESRDDGVIVPIKRQEAAALADVAEIGLDAVKHRN